MAQTIISMKDATKKFGSFIAVDNVSFSVAPGEVVGFVGVNGAGKTTTINMLLGFTSPTKGEVLLFDEGVHPSNAHISHGRVAYAAGDMELPDRLTGRQYIEFVLHQAAGKHTKRLHELTKIFTPQLDKKIHTLSRGNKQKIALVAAFVTEPKLVILDEPTSGLDPIMQAAFLDLIRDEQEKGMTVFMSSHYLQEVAEVCSRVLLMKNGRIVEDLSAQQLESTGGKAVKIITKHPVRPPTKHIKELATQKQDDGILTTFVYDGPADELHHWLSLLRNVTDFEVSERTLEAEFRALYTNEEGPSQ